VRVGKRGKDLAVRIPASLVRSMGLRPDDEVDLKVAGPREIVLVRAPEHDAPEEQREE